MDPNLITLFVHISKMLQMQNPVMVMTGYDEQPASFCSGYFFPITCHYYEMDDFLSVADQMISPENIPMKFNTLFVTEANHEALLREVTSEPLIFSHFYAWVMPLELMSAVPLRLDSNIFFYERGLSGGFNVYEGYAIKGGQPITKKLFQWPDNSRMPMNLPLNRLDLGGTKIDIAWYGWARNTVGRNYEILADLQSQLNFTVKTIPARDKSWGARMKNGSWNGLVGMLHDQQIDMTLGSNKGTVMITQKRATAADYLWADNIVKFTLLALKSRKLRIDAWGYVNIFPITVWLASFSLLIVAVAAYAISSHESLLQCTALMLRLSLQMSYRIPAKKIAAKILMLAAALCLRMIFIYYTGTLKAIMTSETRQTNIRSYEDVITYGYTVTTLPFGSKSYNILADAPNGSAMKRIYKSELHAITASRNCTLAIESMTGNYKALCLGLSNKAGGKLQALDIAEAVPVYRGIALQKDSEFTKLFNHQLLKMFEKGKFHKIDQRWTATYDQDYGMEEPVQLSYEHVLFPYNFLVLGIVIAVPLILVEWLIKRSLPKNTPTVPQILSEKATIQELLNEIEHLRYKNVELESKVKAIRRKSIYNGEI